MYHFFFHCHLWIKEYRVVLNHFEFGVPPLSATLRIWSLQIKAERKAKAQVIAFHPSRELLVNAGIGTDPLWECWPDSVSIIYILERGDHKILE